MTIENTGSAERQMRSLLQRIATGPELSKDISADEARAGMRLILEDRVDPVQAALFLIALRMKRETDDEVLGVQRALLDECCHAQVDVDELVEFADPFNGYDRGLPVSPFLPPVLAACGVPACSHGVKAAGPKYGITHNNVLSAAGFDVGLDLADAARRIADPGIGWAYLDQAVTCPGLHRKLGLRHLMVKRTCLTTLEVALKPVSAIKRTHLVTGYVHKPYPPVYTMLARRAGYQSALIIRGVEGGVVASLQQPSRAVRYLDDSPDEEWRIEPGMAGITGADHRAPPLPQQFLNEEGGKSLDIDGAAAAAARAGMAAINGEPGPAYDSLVYSGALVLAHLGRGPIGHCAGVVRDAIDSGAVAERSAR